jgi:CubicO group peptidase (beta-lactamase class C family)
MLRKYLLPLAVVTAIGAISQSSASAQSLDIHNPTPLVAGENHGTVDSMVGPQFWSFRYHKGKGNVAIRYSSMALFGNAMTTSILVVMHSENGAVWGSKSLTSNGQVADQNWPGTFKGPGTAIVEIRPPGNTLVRSGGDYSITVDGDAVDYSGAGAMPGRDPVVGTYAVMVCAPDFDCQNSLAAHFAADGSVRLTDGHSGSWSVFDPDSHIYSVVIGQDRYSMKLVPGRGLFNTSDLSVVVFQAVRPN